jgi:hypothetical protein
MPVSSSPFVPAIFIIIIVISRAVKISLPPTRSHFPFSDIFLFSNASLNLTEWRQSPPPIKNYFNFHLIYTPSPPHTPLFRFPPCHLALVMTSEVTFGGCKEQITQNG